MYVLASLNAADPKVIIILYNSWNAMNLIQYTIWMMYVLDLL